MGETLTQLSRAAIGLIDDMVAAGIAVKKTYTDERLGHTYINLTTVDAFDKDTIVIAVLGHPEHVGVWSYTLLSQSRIDETTMAPYFRCFAEHGLGLIAINPNSPTPDDEGDRFIEQLQRVLAEVDARSRIGFIGFSMGGRVVIDFLQERPELLDRVAGLVLIDPVLSRPPEVDAIRELLDTHTLLIASEGDINSPGGIASIVLKIPKISHPGIHGQMPNKALPDVIDFFTQDKDTAER